MGCFTDRLAGDIIVNCDHLGIGGVEDDVVLIPHNDLDKTASPMNSSNRMLFDDFACKSTKTGFLLSGIKQVQGFLSEFVPGSDSLDKWRHVFDGVIASPTTANRLQVSKLAKGEPYVVVLRRRFKGNDGADEFLVLGWDAGVYITVMTENSREQDGMIKFTLSSKDESLEYDMVRNLLDTNNATTLTSFNNKFATS
tara:strand:+ start:1000 stop:1590 length:591 start_codon:yes stop_codon:yes gene_type:complete